jgi:hypothetical protein
MDKLFILLISALDFRRITREGTPYLYGLFENYPWTKINTIPETDLVPTLLTGVYPHEHRMWQVKLKSTPGCSSEGLADRLPDILTTTAQCFAHLITGSYNLASIPRWRRRRFEIYKTRYMKKCLRAYLDFNGVDTFLSIVGENRSSYLYNSRLHKLSSALPAVCHPNFSLKLLETHSMDTLQHWYLDDPDKISRFYSFIDGFIKELHNNCLSYGINMLILSDHGQEPVSDSINIRRIFDDLGIPKHEFTYYIEAPKARFWSHSDRAREKIVEALSNTEHGKLLYYKELYDYNVRFEDSRYGEYYFVAKPGYIFFPNDFYHPIGNIYLGLTEAQHRSRLTSPIYRGYHGYLPENESEKGFMILLNDQYKTECSEVELIDFAPTVLGLLGYRKPQYMRGRCIFN